MQQSTDIITIETKIHAFVEQVWSAWTEPSVISKWFGSDADGKVLDAKMEVKPGGSFKINFANGDGSQHTCFGIYEEVKPFSKLSFNWQWKEEPGVNSFVTVLLTKENNFTRMQFTHAHVGTASAHNYLEGWKSTFKKLEKVLVTN